MKGTYLTRSGACCFTAGQHSLGLSQLARATCSSPKSWSLVGLTSAGCIRAGGTSQEDAEEDFPKDKHLQPYCCASYSGCAFNHQEQLQGALQWADTAFVCCHQGIDIQKLISKWADATRKPVPSARRSSAQTVHGCDFSPTGIDLLSCLVGHWTCSYFIHVEQFLAPSIGLVAAHRVSASRWGRALLCQETRAGHQLLVWARALNCDRWLWRQTHGL